MFRLTVTLILLVGVAAPSADATTDLATLGRIATENPHPQIRRSALFWLAQHDDPAVVDFFEAILLR